jgi:hypothetical protein
MIKKYRNDFKAFFRATLQTKKIEIELEKI